MIQFEEPLDGVNIFRGLESPLVIGEIPPVDDSFGLEKHIEQDSIMIFISLTRVQLPGFYMQLLVINKFL